MAKPLHVLVDLQACQSVVHGNRGIGRYAASLVEGLMRHAQGRRLSFLINADMVESASALRRQLLAHVDRSAIYEWSAPSPRHLSDSGSQWRNDAARVIREAMIEAIAPDCLLITSMFEGWVDDCVTSLPSAEAGVATVVIVYDLIPFLYQDIYLRDLRLREWYLRKVEQLANADVVLGISQSASKEVLDATGLPSERVFNISSAVDDRFVPTDISHADGESLRSRLSLDKPFVMYTGGIDHRKNIDLLIKAFAETRGFARSHQLAIVCKVEPAEADRLRDLARRVGLVDGALVLTGFVSNADLLSLYNLATLFVFPSWHEGFGLPVLEAMSVGTPVIVAKSSSLPEVVGPNGQFFDPHNKRSITRAIVRMLSDEDLRQRVANEGLRRSRDFSWDRTAEATWLGLEGAVAARREGKGATILQSGTRPKMAFFSPLPPQRSGIADFSAELLPELVAFYDIELIVEDGPVVPEVDGLALPVRGLKWFLANFDRFDRILYHFGNSEFHSYMFEAIEHAPGTVVLHDFFLGNLHHFLQDTGREPGLWQRALYAGHGYPALQVLAANADRNVTAFRYPCNWGVLSASDGIVVHSTYGRDLVRHWFGKDQEQRVAQMPLLRKAHVPVDRALARRRLGIRDDQCVVATFGMLSSAKCNDALLDSWIVGFGDRSDCVLVFVGQAADPAWECALRQRSDMKDTSNVVITGFVDPETYRGWLASADVAVQLRRQSRGETSAAVLDCFAWSLPTIVNAHGSMAELPAGTAFVIEDNFTRDALIEAMRILVDSPESRHELGRAGRDYLVREHDPSLVAAMYRDAIEHFHVRSSRRILQRAIDRITAMRSSVAAGSADLDAVASGLGPLLGPAASRRQLFLDVSELVKTDARTGIQRVVRSILRELLIRDTAAWRVEPVYTVGDGVYHYARGFTAGFLGSPSTMHDDSPIDIASGDVFVGLDLVPTGVPAAATTLRAMKARGVEVVFVVYDMLPVLHPEWFPPNAPAVLAPWYDTVASLADRVVAISRSVSEEFSHWLETVYTQHRVEMSWFHLGADVHASHPTMGISVDEEALLRRIGDRGNIVLMVGTIEPRKGHDQAMDAFARLRERGVEAQLVIVGKQGWCVEELVERIRGDMSLPSGVIWLPAATDELLDQLYGLASVLLVASRGEGFGLPIVEGAMHGTTVLARDLPVFREVGGAGVFYFSGDDAESLALAIERALDDVQRGHSPDMSKISVLTWAQSASHFLDAVTDESHDLLKTAKI